MSFVIPSSAARVARNGRLLAKQLSGKLYVLFETDDAGDARVPIAGQTLRIGLRLSNPYFTNFTAVADDFASSFLLYRNAAAPASLDPPINAMPIGEVFTHTLEDNIRPVTAKLKNSDGQVWQTDKITGNNSAISYDLRGQRAGLYTIRETYPAKFFDDTYYYDPDLTQAGVFGIVEITIATGFYDAAPEFEVTFEAREDTLKYYVVANNYAPADFNLLSVSDSGFAGDGRPQITFQKVPAGSFAATDIPPTLLTSSSSKVVLFKSKSAVARSQKPRKGVQLLKNSQVLVENLPQPRPETPNGDLVIPVSKQ
ncbi:MAG: hypothetical protein H0X40_17745 [Chthoniobacterales bacterium]|nr:hypothetical protein [Chthoniobacterales bacterium]